MASCANAWWLKQVEKLYQPTDGEEDPSIHPDQKPQSRLSCRFCSRALVGSKEPWPERRQEPRNLTCG